MKAVIKPMTERQTDQTTSWDLFFCRSSRPFHVKLCRIVLDYLTPAAEDCMSMSSHLKKQVPAFIFVFIPIHFTPKYP